MKTIPRIQNIYRPEATRVEDYNEVERKFNTDELTMQASRCMDCGIPFCHGLGCPLGNVIPEMNEAARTLNWKRAWEICLNLLAEYALPFVKMPALKILKMYL